MCGRFSQHHDGTELRDHFYLAPEYAVHMELRARYNVSPGQDIAAITSAQPRVLTPMHWGLIPSWAKEKSIGYKMINARGETAPEKPSFRAAFKKRRCVIPTSGWYEWRKNPDKTKTPIYFHRKDGKPLAFAGLWEQWTSPSSQEVTSCTIITMAAAPQFTTIHDRMPLVLGSVDEWLSEELAPEAAKNLLTSPDVSGIETYAVSSLVNAGKMDSPKCIERVEI